MKFKMHRHFFSLILERFGLCHLSKEKSIKLSPLQLLIRRKYIQVNEGKLIKILELKSLQFYDDFCGRLTLLTFFAGLNHSILFLFFFVEISSIKSFI